MSDARGARPGATHDHTEPVPEYDATEPVPEFDGTEPVSDSNPRPGRTPRTGLDLPAALAGRYALDQELTTRPDADARVFRAHALVGSEGPHDVVIKLYDVPERDYEIGTIRHLQGVGSLRIAGILDVAISDGRPYEVLEYLPGGTLRTLMPAGRRVAPELVRDVLTQVAEGLRAIHSRPVVAVHRDIKPANILLRTATPLDLAIGDFGLVARSATVWRAWALRQGARGVGTRRYWSPQHLSGASDPKADWYSVGLIVHEALFGHHPFDDPTGGQASDERLREILEGRTAIPLDVHEDPRWNDLLANLTRFDPLMRWDYEGVSAWLAGKSPTPPPTAPPKGAYSGPGFPFNVGTYGTYEQLAAAMLEHYVPGERFVTNIAKLTELAQWAGRRGDVTMEERIRHLAVQFEQDNASPAGRLVAVARTLHPAVEPNFRGRRITAAGLAKAVTSAMDKGAARELAMLRTLFDTGALRELAQIQGQAPQLALVPDGWGLNYGLVDDTRERANIKDVRRTLADRDDTLFGLALRLALYAPAEREKVRRQTLPRIGNEQALQQDWFAVLFGHGSNEFTELEDPRDGQEAAMSAYLAGLLVEAARAAEIGIIRRMAADEPPGFPDTPGGRREDVDYSEQADPPSRIGQRPVAPRPAFPRFDPSWIFRASSGGVGLAVLLFRAVTLVGATIVILGVLRLVWLDHVLLVDPDLPRRLAGDDPGPLGWWAALHSSWTSIPVLAAVNPLSAWGAWVPLLLGGATIVSARVARLSLRPPVTAFKDAAPPRGRRWRILLSVLAAVALLALWAPWVLLLSVPLLIVLVLSRRH